MPYSDHFSRLFDAKTRQRGHQYFRDGNVFGVEVTDDGVSLQVEGSSPSPYEVFLPYDDFDLGEVHCDCPRFADGYLCKHIWAAILALDESEDDSSPDGDFDAWMDNAVADYTAGRGNGERNTKRAPAKSPPWQHQLREVAELAENLPGRNLELPISTSQKQNEVWYALNVGQTLASGQMTIDLWVRETKKDGTWGKFKSLSTSRNALGTFTLGEDRQALAHLFGHQPESSPYGYNYGFRYSSWESDTSRLRLTPALFDVTLPLLAATGRLVWLLESDESIDPERKLTWDDGEPWQFQMRVEQDKQAKVYRVRGCLHRDATTRPLEQAVITQTGRAVLWEQSLARMDSGDASAWLALLRRDVQIEVPFADADAFAASLWEQGQPPIDDLPAALQLTPVEAPPRGRFQVQRPPEHYYRRDRNLYAKVSFEYGDQTVGMYETRPAIVDAESKQVSLRDWEAERLLLEQLEEFHVRPLRGYEQEHGDVAFLARRLGEIVATLVQRGWAVEAEGKLIRAPGDYSLSVNSGVDWFELDGEFDFDGVSATLPELLAAVKKGDQYVRLGDGSQGLLPEQWLQKYSGLLEMADTDGDKLRFRPTQAMLLDAMLAAQESVSYDRSFRGFRKRLEKFDGVQPRSAPRGFQGELREYQQQGLGWLHFLREFNFGGCLADDMGLGKTVQVLALLESRRTRRVGKGETRSPSLVVVPKSLVFNWIDEAARFTPRLRLLDYTGLGRKKKREQFDEYDLIVTTYGTLRKDIAHLKDTRFDYAILDESQAIKNDKSQAAKACRLIQADHRLAMTGTPVENHLGELWSLFEFLNPGMLGASSTASSLMKSAGKGEEASLEMLRQGLAPYMLRRTKEQVLTELPGKSEQTLHCEMDTKQRKAYNELREYYRASLADRIEDIGMEKSRIHVLEALLRLRQAACHPGLLDAKKIKQPSAKLDTLLQQVEEVVEEGHKALVFSQFTSLLSIVRTHLDKRKITYEYLDGRTRKRQQKVARFQEDPACPLFLISLKAGGHGLNLTAADYVYILDPWWNPAVEAQAVDRAHRIGQTRPVFAYRLICRDTVEEKIIELQARKRDLADAIVSQDSSILRGMTADDLQLLLS